MTRTERIRAIEMLEFEYDQACAFESNAAKLTRELTDDPRREDGLEDVARRIAFNRRLQNLHLSRAEAILGVMGYVNAYQFNPEFQGDPDAPEYDWLDSGTLERAIALLREDEEDEL